MVEATPHTAASLLPAGFQSTSAPNTANDSGTSPPSTVTTGITVMENYQSTNTPPVSAIRGSLPSIIGGNSSVAGRRKTVSSGSLGSTDGGAAEHVAQNRSPGRSSSSPAPHPSSPPSLSPLHSSHIHQHRHHPAAQHWPQNSPVVLNPLAQSVIALEDSSSYSECEEYPTPGRIQLQQRLRRSSSTTSAISTSIAALISNSDNGSGETSSPVMTAIGVIGGAMHGSSPIKKLYASAASVDSVIDAGAKGDNEEEEEEGGVSS